MKQTNIPRTQVQIGTGSGGLVSGRGALGEPVTVGVPWLRGVYICWALDGSAAVGRWGLAPVLPPPSGWALGCLQDMLPLVLPWLAALWAPWYPWSLPSCCLGAVWCGAFTACTLSPCYIQCQTFLPAHRRLQVSITSTRTHTHTPPHQKI